MFLRARLLSKLQGKVFVNKRESYSGIPSRRNRGRRRTRPKQLGSSQRGGSEGARRFAASWFPVDAAGPRSRSHPRILNSASGATAPAAADVAAGKTASQLSPGGSKQSAAAGPEPPAQFCLFSGSAFPFGTRYPHARARSRLPLLLPTTPSTLRGRQGGRPTAARGGRRARGAGACPRSSGPTQEPPGRDLTSGASS